MGTVQNRKQCTKCSMFISGDFRLCSYCYSNYTKSTKKLGTPDYHNLVHINSTPEVRDFYFIGDIWSNEIMCIECRDIVRSKNKHDHRACKCGLSWVDGGSHYQRRGGSCESIITQFKNLKTNANV